MQAQVERERQSRAVSGDSEKQIAEKFVEASLNYKENPMAFHLRAMNMLYEGLKKDNSTIVIVPSSATESIQLGNYAGMTALTMGIKEQNKARREDKNMPGSIIHFRRVSEERYCPCLSSILSLAKVGPNLTYSALYKISRMADFTSEGVFVRAWFTHIFG